MLLGPRPHLGYTASRIDRVASQRSNQAAVTALEQNDGTRAYVLTGEMVLLQKTPAGLDPLMTPAAARQLGRLAETAFLGLHEGAARFAIAIEAAALEALKSDEKFMVTDLRSIAARS